MAPSSSTLAPDDLRTRLRSAHDLASWSDELTAETAWPLTYFVSPARANVLRGLRLPLDGRVLEIGARAGAVTRYLGEQAPLVDALEPDTTMAEAAAIRCAGLDSVAVFAAWLEDVPAEPTYDLVVAVDVLGELSERNVPLGQFVADCRARLQPAGVLVLCGDNVEGVRHRAGGLPPAPGVASAQRPDWLSLDALRDAVAEAGLQVATLSAFPDHRHTKVLYDRASLVDVDPLLLERLPSFPSPSYGAPVVDAALEATLWTALVRDGQDERGANSIVAVITEGEPLTPSFAATYWSMNRAAAVSACNRLRLETDGSVIVERDHAFPRAPRPDVPLRLRPQTEPYVVGTSLVEQIGAARSTGEACRLLRRWVEIVHDADGHGDVPWDLIARNVVVDDEDRLHLIDQEWELRGATAETVLRRGVFWLAADLLALPVRPSWIRGSNHGQVSDFLWRLAGQDPLNDWLSTFVAEEAHATSFVAPLRPPRTHAHTERQNGRILTAISRSSSPQDEVTPSGDRVDDAASLQAVVDSLLETNEQLRDQLEELDRLRRHDALTQRDHVIGVTAELEVMRDRVGRALAAQKLAMTKVRRLRKQVADMQASTTWRVGRSVVRPVARLTGRR